MNRILSIAGEGETANAGGGMRNDCAHSSGDVNYGRGPLFFRFRSGKASRTFIYCSPDPIHFRDMFYDEGDKESTYWRICLHILRASGLLSPNVSSNHLIYFIAPGVCECLRFNVSFFLPCSLFVIEKVASMRLLARLKRNTQHIPPAPFCLI